MGDQYAAQANKVTPPKSGEVTVTNVNTTAASLSLATIGTSAVSASKSSDSSAQGSPPFCINRYVRFSAINANVTVIFGPNQGAVTNSNAPNAANVGLATSTANAPGCAEPIGAGTWVDYFIDESASWIGYVGSANGTLVIRPSSQPL